MKNHPHIEPGDAESWHSPGGCQVWFPNGQPIIPREIRIRKLEEKVLHD